ncbi:hypothetical protein [Bacillus sp. JJ1562]|uniref:hypothetical protein n=1 Tax=Bacillus sp. JJ1562 TaxID=3122960 RepID=UPI0030021615
MKNYTNDNTARRYIANVGLFGTSIIHLRNPYIAGWWSAAFPGFGHLMLGKYHRGYFLVIWEIVVNINANINLAMIHSFQGNIDLAKYVLDTRWVLMYIPLYIFCIWDSYRSAIDLNRMYILADHENHRFNTFIIGDFGMNYLDKRNPALAIVWSLFMPGLGHLYNHKTISSIFIIICCIVFFYFSHALEAVSLLFLGKIDKATAVLDPEWFMFLPSIFGFAIYDSYINSVENNKLYERVQRKFLRENYQSSQFQVLKGQKVK